MQLIHSYDQIKLPEWAKCPICGADITIEEIAGYVQSTDGSWVADEVSVDCVTAPAGFGKKKDAYLDHHWSMPYVDWLPLNQRLLAYLEQNYRFDIEDMPPAG